MTVKPLELTDEMIEGLQKAFDFQMESFNHLKRDDKGNILCEHISGCKEIATCIGMGDSFWCETHYPKF